MFYYTSTCTFMCVTLSNTCTSIICCICFIGEEVDLSECRDPHTIAGLLKLHFREQRQCIIPGDAVVQRILQAVEKRDVSGDKWSDLFLLLCFTRSRCKILRFR